MSDDEKSDCVFCRGLGGFYNLDRFLGDCSACKGTGKEQPDQPDDAPDDADPGVIFSNLMTNVANILNIYLAPCQVDAPD